MTDFRPPASTLRELERIIGGFNHFDEAVTPADVAGVLTDITESRVERNVPFLKAAGLVERCDGGIESTSLGRRLGKAATLDIGSERQTHWRKVIETTEVLSEQLSTLREEGPMEREAFASAIHEAAEVGASQSTRRGCDALVEAFLTSDLVEKNGDGRLRVSPHVADEPTRGGRGGGEAKSTGDPPPTAEWPPADTQQFEPPSTESDDSSGETQAPTPASSESGPSRLWGGSEAEEEAEPSGEGDEPAGSQAHDSGPPESGRPDSGPPGSEAPPAAGADGAGAPDENAFDENASVEGHDDWKEVGERIRSWSSRQPTDGASEPVDVTVQTGANGDAPVTLNVNLQIDETTDPEVVDAVLRSIREHLLQKGRQGGERPPADRP
jgi:hypothetical protein